MSLLIFVLVRLLVLVLAWVILGAVGFDPNLKFAVMVVLIIVMLIVGVTQMGHLSL